MIALFRLRMEVSGARDNPIFMPEDHTKRRFEDKESARWLKAAESAAEVLGSAEQIVVVGNRESASTGCAGGSNSCFERSKKTGSTLRADHWPRRPPLLLP